MCVGGLGGRGAAWSQLLKFLLPKAYESISPLKGQEWALRSSKQGLQAQDVGPAGVRSGDECGKNTLLRATSWGQLRGRGQCHCSPRRRRVDFHLKKNLTCCDSGSGGQDSVPSRLTSPDLGRVTGGCLPSRGLSQLFPPHTLLILLIMGPLLKIPVLGPTHPDLLSGISRGGGRGLWFGYCYSPSVIQKNGQSRQMALAMQ